MEIQILCQECEECAKLERNVVAAANDIGIEYSVKRIFDRNRMSFFGATGRPELVIDGELRSVGRVLSQEELKRMFIYFRKSSTF